MDADTITRMLVTLRGRGIRLLVGGLVTLLLLQVLLVVTGLRGGDTVRLGLLLLTLVDALARAAVVAGLVAIVLGSLAGLAAPAPGPLSSTSPDVDAARRRIASTREADRLAREAARRSRLQD